MGHYCCKQCGQRYEYCLCDKTKVDTWVPPKARFKSVSTAFNEGTFDCEFTKEQISNEPMFYRANSGFAWKYGGPITRAFLDKMPLDWWAYNVTIDSRCHMLMPGWYPCIPGWHHDDVARIRSDGQPDYERETYRAEHLIGLVNAEVAPTQFALGEFDLEIPDVGKTVYKEWHPEVQKLVDCGKLATYNAKSGDIIWFDSHSWHRGVAATKSGWRWFIRVSRNTPRALDCKNEIRKQTQVYMADVNDGW